MTGKAAQLSEPPFPYCEMGLLIFTSWACWMVIYKVRWSGVTLHFCFELLEFLALHAILLIVTFPPPCLKAMHIEHTFLHCHRQRLCKPPSPSGSAHLDSPAATVYHQHLPIAFHLKDLGVSVFWVRESSEFVPPGCCPPTGSGLPSQDAAHLQEACFPLW